MSSQTHDPPATSLWSIRRLWHSAADLRARRTHASGFTLIVGLAADLLVAAAKLAAGLITGSSALLGEAAHSLADSTNEVMLGVSYRQARRPPDKKHPFGYGGLRFLWAFLAAIASFLIGGCLSIALGTDDLVHGNVLSDHLIAWAVIGFAVLAEGTALLQTLAQARREAARLGMQTVAYLHRTSDPTLRALAVQDTAALAGLALAAAGTLVHDLGGPAASDSIASILIGLLLAVTAVVLARPLADLLIGRSIMSERSELARRTLAGSPGVDEIREMYAVNVAPDEVMLAAEVVPDSELSADELAREMDDVESRLRAEVPEIGWVFIDVTEHNNRKGDRAVEHA